MNNKQIFTQEVRKGISKEKFIQWTTVIRKYKANGGKCPCVDVAMMTYSCNSEDCPIMRDRRNK